MAKFIGVDGCPAGWFATWLDIQPGSEPVLRCQIITDMAELLALHPDATRVLVDMPIGLMADETRDVETQVRKLIGPRRSSVFSVPCFDAVYANSYERANQTNRTRLGKGLSKQAWFLCPKIRDINDLLSQDTHAKKVIGECHPELAFRIFNQAHLHQGKKTPEGVEQRLQILRTLLPEVDTFVAGCLASFKRKQLVLDDCLDALVLLATARNAVTLDTVRQTGIGEIDVAMWLPNTKSLEKAN